jgi:hypothetical protein
MSNHCRGPYGFLPNLRFEVGMGTRVSFWLDRCCGALSLKDKFPKLYLCTVDKEASVSC